MEMPAFQKAISDSVLSLTPDHILPEEKRPKLDQVSHSSAMIPVIDLSGYLNETCSAAPALVQQVSEACKQYGFFQIVNHGVPDELCRRILLAATEVFHQPHHQERAELWSDDPTKDVKFGNYYLKVNGDQEKVNMWSEYFSHPWHPSDDFTSTLPKILGDYREVAADYAEAVDALVGRLLSLISQGLGLTNDYLKKRIGVEEPRRRAQINYYPPSPNPELTLGLSVHTDLNAITVLLQKDGVTGLQVLKDGEWVAVAPVSKAFVVNLGDQIQVLSNGVYKSVHHRAVSNKEVERVSLAMFYGPSKDTVVGPIEELIEDGCPAVYRKYRMSEFLDEFFRQQGTRRMAKEVFEL